MRKTSRNRDNAGGNSLTPKKVADPTVQLALNSIYKELNALKRSVNSKPNYGSSTPNEGEEGDLRLFTKPDNKGGKGYFLQGKFGQNWATVQLELNKNKEEALSLNATEVDNYEDGGPDISIVTFENLSINQDIGMGSEQVPPGTHTHSHTKLDDKGINTHDQIDTHISTDNIHFQLSNSPLGQNIGTNLSSTVKAGSSLLGSRVDHTHNIDQGITPTWTGIHNFTQNAVNTAVTITQSNSGGKSLVLNNSSGGTALDVTGDVDITGNLTVDFAGNTTTTANFEGNVLLNTDNSPNPSTNTTTIYGHTDFMKTLKVNYALTSGEHHITIQGSADTNDKAEFDVNDEGTLQITTTNGNIELHPDNALVPKSDGVVSLGLHNRKWSTLYATEIYAETLVAQDVMATIGGRIMVAPTTKLTTGINSTTQTINVKHNIFEADDYILFKTAPGGVAQQEVMEIVSGPTASGNGYDYTVTRNVDSNGANSWLADDACVNLGHEAGDGYIEITSTETILNDLGPAITLYSRDSESTWNSSKPVVQVGNLSGYQGISSNTRFGIIAGKNIENTAIDSSNPFAGLVADNAGVKMYNTPFIQYDGSSAKVFIGKTDNSSTKHDYNSPVFAIGDGLDFDATGDGAQWDNARLLWYKTIGGGYALELDAEYISLSNANSWGFFNSGDDVLNSIDHFVPPGHSFGSGSSNGFYLTSEWLGFWKYDASAETNWPVQIGNVGSNPFLFVGKQDHSEFLRYTESGGLEVKGTITAVNSINSYQNLFVRGSMTGSDTYLSITSGGNPSTTYTESNPTRFTRGKLTVRYSDVETADTAYVQIGTKYGADSDDTIEWVVLGFLPTTGNDTVGEHTYEFDVLSDSSFVALGYEYIETGEVYIKVETLTSPSNDWDLIGYKMECEIASQLGWQVTDDSSFLSTTFSDAVTIGGGSITIGNIDGSSIRTFNKTSFADTDPGIYLGIEEHTRPEGEGGGVGLDTMLNIGNNETYIKYSSGRDGETKDLLEIEMGPVGLRIGENVSDTGDYTEVIIGSWAQQDMGDEVVAAGEGILVKHGADDWTEITGTGIQRRQFDFPAKIYERRHIGMPTRFSINAFNANADFEEHRYGADSTIGSNWSSYFDSNGDWEDSDGHGWSHAEGKRAGEALMASGSAVENYDGDDNTSVYLAGRSGYILGERGRFHGMLPFYWASSYGGNSEHLSTDWDEETFNQVHTSSNNAFHSSRSRMYPCSYWGARDTYYGADGRNMEGDTGTTERPAVDSTPPTYNYGTNFYYETPTANHIGGIRNAYRLPRCTYENLGSTDYRYAFQNNATTPVFNDQTENWPWRTAIYPHDVHGAHIGWKLCKSFNAGGTYPDTVPAGRKLIYKISGAFDEQTAAIPYLGLSPGSRFWNWGFYGGIFGFGVYEQQDFIPESGIQTSGGGSGPTSGTYAGAWYLGGQPKSMSFLYNLKKTSHGTHTGAYNSDGNIGVDKGEFFRDMYAGFNDDVQHTTFMDGLFKGGMMSPWMLHGGGPVSSTEASVKRKGDVYAWTEGQKGNPYELTGNNSDVIWQRDMTLPMNFKKYLEGNTKVFKGEIGPGEDVSSLHVFGCKFVTIEKTYFPRTSIPFALIPKVEIWEVDA